jgi:peroxiredoxin
MRRSLIFALLLFSFFNCKNDPEIKTLEIGTYRAVLSVQDGQTLPFIFKVTSTNSLEIYNGEEVVKVDEVSYRNDSVFFQTPVFESYVAAVFEGNDLKGKLINKTRNRVSPFYAEFQNDERFNINKQAIQNVTGAWETVFSAGETGEYKAQGIFNQVGNKVNGTFRTASGDYRFLEGVVDGDSLKLSTFDGAHAFLFVAKVSDSLMDGVFYSGNHWREPFAAKRNPTFELPIVDELTQLNEGYDRLEFSFPDETGQLVSHDDMRFQNKVVMVMIMGTWCPNCLDGSKYYAQFYAEHQDDDFEMVALAVEFVKTKEKAFANINRLRDGVGMEYPILLAQYGTGSKSKLQEKLPMLDEISAYPTTIIIDKTGKVRKIYTGFNGPATGEKHTAFKKEFEGFIEELLGE